MSLEAIVSQYGLPALFVGAGVEGETVVMLGGMLVHRGLLSFWPAILAASLGSLTADQLFFLIGRRLRSWPLVERTRHRPAFKRARQTFERYPTGFILLFRFLYGLRTISPMAIGTTDVPATRFLALNALAALIWGTLFITLGYWFGQGIQTVFGRARHYEYVLAFVAGIAAVVLLVLHIARRRHNRRGDALPSRREGA
ncbi:DedA family protein [Stakelama sediminis]|uniref:Membrane protein DedA with SNARE-associated domain n=1 Tax=Stakelama sediminis TaxID=463200 RepID=A0A840Z279_9SPHN|nr:DedA family protein [Stakelama sediminis]MBB5719840.1 membrane protein DedA with SNARE-associated domain [Stakelama sediminis]